MITKIFLIGILKFMGLLNSGFIIKAVEEAKPSGKMMDIPEMKDEMCCPMMLLVKVNKE